MSLTLYNTLTRRKETFQPIDPGNVRMYVCGPTVYDLAHIGNARPVIVFDVLYRLLRHIYGAEHVTYARNITDVDDKINARALERFPDMAPTDAIRRLTKETAEQFHKDIAALGVLRPTVEPRATDHIAEMRALCETLVAKGHAYVAQEHVLFDAASMPDYGRLANRSLEEMEAGARVDVAPYKKGPTDFVLWKPSTPVQPGWPSPCGIKTPGRPGWHIECSAMAEKHLGPIFDIHGGGIDLVFPHHENEIAQSRCAHGTPVMANYWMHNGFLQVEGEKMSKSLGNFITIRELLETDAFGGQIWAGQVLRHVMLSTHYRQPIDWTASALVQARSELERWAIAILDSQVNNSAGLKGVPSHSLIENLNDDLNTPGGIAVLRNHYREYMEGNAKAAETLLFDCEFLGLLRRHALHFHVQSAVVSTPALWGKLKIEVSALKAAAANSSSSVATVIIGRAASQGANLSISTDGFVTIVADSDESKQLEARVASLMAARLEARKAKDFAESDRIRDELAAMGIALKDAKNKQTGEIETTWEVKR